MAPHSTTQMLTRSTEFAPGGDCPRWLGFIKDITGGDDELAGYLQRLAGYALSGSAQEHMLAFLHGTGANGKSVFLNVLRDVMGDYAKR